jgi:hypothetical protein
VRLPPGAGGAKAATCAPVLFFGTNEVGLVPRREITPFGDGVRQGLAGKGKANARLANALKQVCCLVFCWVVTAAPHAVHAARQRNNPPSHTPPLNG